MTSTAPAAASSPRSARRADIAALSREDPFWRVAPLLDRLASEGSGFG